MCISEIIYLVSLKEKVGKKSPKTSGNAFSICHAVSEHALHTLKSHIYLTTVASGGVLSK